MSLSFFKLKKKGLFRASGIFLVCLFGFFLSHSRIFHSCGDVTINVDLCPAFMPIEQWGFFSVAHLLWHGAGHPFIMVISKGLWHSHLLPSVWQWSCHYLSKCLYDVGLSRLGFKHPERCKFRIFWNLQVPQISDTQLTTSPIEQSNRDNKTHMYL